MSGTKCFSELLWGLRDNALRQIDNHIRPAIEDTFRHSRNTHESIKRQKKECVREKERERENTLQVIESFIIADIANFQIKTSLKRIKFRFFQSG